MKITLIPKNSFLKISLVVIEIFRKFKMAFVHHIKRQMNIEKFQLQPKISSENCFWRWLLRVIFTP